MWVIVTVGTRGFFPYYKVLAILLEYLITEEQNVFVKYVKQCVILMAT